MKPKQLCEVIFKVFEKCQLFLIKSSDKSRDGSNEPHPSAIIICYFPVNLKRSPNFKQPALWSQRDTFYNLSALDLDRMFSRSDMSKGVDYGHLTAKRFSK